MQVDDDYHSRGDDRGRKSRVCVKLVFYLKKKRIDQNDSSAVPSEQSDHKHLQVQSKCEGRAVISQEHRDGIPSN